MEYKRNEIFRNNRESLLLHELFRAISDIEISLKHLNTNSKRTNINDTLYFVKLLSSHMKEALHLIGYGKNKPIIETLIETDSDLLKLYNNILPNLMNPKDQDSNSINSRFLHGLRTEAFHYGKENTDIKIVSEKEKELSNEMPIFSLGSDNIPLGIDMYLFYRAINDPSIIPDLASLAKTLIKFMKQLSKMLLKNTGL